LRGQICPVKNNGKFFFNFPICKQWYKWVSFLSFIWFKRQKHFLHHENNHKIDKNFILNFKLVQISFIWRIKGNILEKNRLFKKTTFFKNSSTCKSVVEGLKEFSESHKISWKKYLRNEKKLNSFKSQKHFKKLK